MQESDRRGSEKTDDQKALDALRELLDPYVGDGDAGKDSKEEAEKNSATSDKPDEKKDDHNNQT